MRITNAKSNNQVELHREKYEYAALEYIQSIFQKRPEIKKIELAGHTQLGNHTFDIIATTQQNTKETIEVKGSVLMYNVNRGKTNGRMHLNAIKLQRKDIEDLPNWFLFIFDVSQFGTGETDFRYMMLPGKVVKTIVPRVENIIKIPYYKLIKIFEKWEKPWWLK